MKLTLRTLSCAVGMSGLVLGVLTASQGVAAAATSATCTGGTITAPSEVAAGTYSSLTIAGTCFLQSGAVTVLGNLTVAPNASFNAVYGVNGTVLTVDGNMIVQQNAAVVMGCDSIFVNVWGLHHLINVPSFPCVDDPSQNAPTFNSHDVIRGNLVENQAAGVVLNNDTVNGNIVENGGGGGSDGVNCIPDGIFNLDFGFPPYSGYLDSTVGGNIVISNLNTCWLGAFRNQVGGNVVITNNFNGNTDGNEIAANVVHGNLVCQGNSPVMQFGDGQAVPSQVAGNAIGECAFGVTALTPAPEVGVIGVTPVPALLTVPLN